MTASVHVIAGAGSALEQALDIATACGLRVEKFELATNDHFNFDLSALRECYPANDTAVFAALDPRAVNFARLKLLADIRLAGYAGFNLISPLAHVATSARLLGNVLAAAGVNIGSGCRIGIGSWLEAGVVLDHDVRTGTGVWLKARTVVGAKADIGTGTTIGEAAVVPAEASIGRHCEWLLPGDVPAQLPARSFFDRLMPQGACVLAS